MRAICSGKVVLYICLRADASEYDRCFLLDAIFAESRFTRFWSRIKSSLPNPKDTQQNSRKESRRAQYLLVFFNISIYAIIIRCLKRFFLYWCKERVHERANTLSNTSAVKRKVGQDRRLESRGWTLTLRSQFFARRELEQRFMICQLWTILSLSSDWSLCVGLCSSLLAREGFIYAGDGRQLLSMANNLDSSESLPFSNSLDHRFGG
jgi:hypothetical protein